MADDPASPTFFFADHLALDESPTRDFYKSVLQGLIHKNNNLLGVIQGFSSLILMDDDVPPGIRENVEQMRDSSIQGSDLSKIILAAAGCSRVTNDRMNLTDMLPHIERTARELCDKNGVPLEFHARPALPAIQADSNRLTELLAALIANAAEAAATVPGGEVAIDLLPPGEASPAAEGRVDLLIRNSSPDLSPAKIREAFIPFHGSKSSHHFGLGLTLAGVLAGQMKMRLGLRSADGTVTAWLSMPGAG